MSEYIEAPKVSEILSEEFMKPLGISAYRLSHELGVPVSRVQDLLHDRRRVTADTSIRLGRFFGVSDRYFLNIQSDIDIRNEEHNRKDEFDKIKTASFA
ncbi:MAG: HigA family addiction module antitoxin [Candidatus Weimeria sp.]